MVQCISTGGGGGSFPGRLRVYSINSLKMPNFMFSSRKIIYAPRGETAHANSHEVRGTRSNWRPIRPREANFTFVRIRSLSLLYA